MAFHVLVAYLDIAIECYWVFMSPVKVIFLECKSSELETHIKEHVRLIYCECDKLKPWNILPYWSCLWFHTYEFYQLLL